MPSSLVVPAFNPLKDWKRGLGLVRITPGINAFNFYSLKEAFSNCVIPAITFPTHASGYQLICIQYFSEIITSILDTPIWMKNQIFSDWAVSYGHKPRRNNSVSSGEIFLSRTFGAIGYLCLESVVALNFLRFLAWIPAACMILATRFFDTLLFCARNSAVILGLPYVLSLASKMSRTSTRRLSLSFQRSEGPFFSHL